MENRKSVKALRIPGPVYAMNSRTSLYLKENPKALPVAVTCYHAYYKTVQKAAKDLRMQINALISGAEVIIEKK